jgi:hypothetical protein
MRARFVLVAIAALLLTGGCGSSSSPSAPTPPAVISSAAVKSLHVTGPALVVGDATQFSAVASFADGTQQDVTAASAWTTSNPR